MMAAKSEPFLPDRRSFMNIHWRLLSVAAGDAK